MPRYAVHNIRQPVTWTGIVEQVMEWEETPEGKRRPSEKQARNEKTSMPLWAVEVLYIQTAFGRESTVTAKVTVDAADEPTPSRGRSLARRRAGRVKPRRMQRMPRRRCRLLLRVLPIPDAPIRGRNQWTPRSLSWQRSTTRFGGRCQAAVPLEHTR